MSRPARHGAALAVALMLVGAPSAGAVTITEHDLPGAAPATGITSSGGSLWAAAPGQILRIAPDASAQAFTGGGIASTVPLAIAPGPVGDTKVWFAEQDDEGNGAVGSVTPAGVVTRYPDEITDAPGVADITPGGTVVWFTESLVDAIGRIRVSDNTLDEFDEGIDNGLPSGIAVGADGNVWFTEQDSPGAVARYVPATGVVTEFTAGLTPGGEPGDIVAGPAGALYFTIAGGIGRITTTGAVAEFRIGISPGAIPRQLTVGPDGAVWFTEAGDRIGRLDPLSGSVTEYGAGITPGGRPEGITTGPDGALWFTLPGTGKVGRLSLQDPQVPTEPTPTPSPTATPTPVPPAAPAPAPPPIAAPAPAPRRALSLRAPARVRGTTGRPVRIAFRLNRRAVVRVVIRRAGRARITRRVRGRAGRNLVLVGPLAAGRWTARLSARAADGRRARDSVAIVVRAAAAPAPRFTG